MGRLCHGMLLYGIASHTASASCGIQTRHYVSNSKVFDHGDVAGSEANPLSIVTQGQYQTAISHLKRVLEISKEMGDHVGDADAYGVIADIYTDLNDFDQAAIYYDKYIETMTTEGSVV